MSQYVFKLPDLGEGTVEAEIVGWRVKPGDQVAEDEVIVEVMTEKAAVEVPAPVSGRVRVHHRRTGRHGAGGRAAHRAGDAAGGGRAKAARALPAASAAPAGRGLSRAARTAWQRRGGRAGCGCIAARSRERALRPRRRFAAAHTRPASTCGRSPARARAGASCRRTWRPRGARRAPPTPLRTARRRRSPAARAPAARGAPAGTEEIKVIGLRRADRAAHERGEAQHPALRLRRGARRHRARGAAAAPEQQARAAAPPALTYLPFLALALVRVLRDVPAVQRPLRRRARRAGALSRRASGRRHADSRRAQGAGGARCAGARACGSSPRRCGA